MTPADLAASLDAIAGRAAALRDAGVREISIDGVVVKIAAPEPPIVVADANATAKPRNMSPSHDPETYGLPPGSDVPGLDWAELAQATDRRDRELGRGGKARRG